MDWYKHDITAYKRHTRSLTPTQHGIYRMLLDEYYATQSPLPEDQNYLALVCRCVTKRDKLALNVVLAMFFPLNGDGSRHNARADEEIHDYIERCSTNRTAARSRYAVPSQSGEHANRSLETDRHTKRHGAHACEQYLDNGKKCGEPTELRLGNQWLCRPHHPYLKG